MKHFCDNICVLTDRMGGWLNQNIEVGWYDKISKKYYNLDEVREFYYADDTSNVGMKEDGTLYMKSCYLDARTAFTVVCGIPFGNFDNVLNLLGYCKNHNIVTKGPQPIDMYAGIKSLYISSLEKYTVKYQIYERIWNIATDKDKEYIRKMCLGKISKLRHNYMLVHETSEPYKRYDFQCSNVSFENHTLIISDITYKSMAERSFIDAIRELDLQILMCLSDTVNFWNIFRAVRQEAFNQGQYHLFGVDHQDDLSEITWYKKDFEED